jgi:hypothetical protein
MSLYSFLTRLILLCISPLVLLAAYLAIDSVRTTQAERDLKAAGLARAFANEIDQELSARIGALSMLAASPLAQDAARRGELYQEAQGFFKSFGSHVILADLDMRMLFNTRVPFGSTLPMLPRPQGNAAVPAAIESGRPAVGDAFMGPIAKESLVAVAVPGQNGGQTAFIVLTVFETRQFQKSLDRLVLPADWSLSVVDGKGETLARRYRPDGQTATVGDNPERFVVKSAVSPWSVVLEIPRTVYRAPLVEAAVALIIALAGAIFAGMFGGLLASRRLGRAVESLVRPEHPKQRGGAPSSIAEIVAVRRLINESAEQREEAEVARRESEQRFLATFEQAAVGIALVAPDGRLLRVNRKLCDIAGYSRDELQGKTFQDITHPEDLGADLSRVRQMLAGEIETYALEKRYLHKNGAVVWVNITVALVRRDDGTPDYFISVIEDIQARKAAEAALVASEAKLKEAQRLAGIGHWSWDLRTGRHLWSEDIYRIYGRDPALPPAVYPEVQQYFTAESWARLAATVEQAMTQGAAYECDAEVVRPDGHRWITARGTVTRDETGVVVELHGTVQDITQRKRGEEEMRNLNATLEQRVEQRTAELSAANRELETFAYAVSHDLRAPLRAMTGFATALIEDFGQRLEGDARSYLEQIDIASRKMGELIDGILALSRSTRGDLQRSTIDLSALAGRLLSELARAEPGRAVATEVEPGLSVYADARMFEAMLGNLLGNAWKYTARTPHPLIRVCAGELDGQRGICVADNGAGFDMAHAGSLFQPFRRLHRQDEFPGLGIGLATVQRIANRHGGVIRASAVPGDGATFCFSLPGESEVR